jgi:hypothetical protein
MGDCLHYTHYLLEAGYLIVTWPAVPQSGGITNSFCGRRKTLKKEPLGENLPSLMVFWGSDEQNPRQWDNEPLEKYESRKQKASDFRMSGNALDLCEMLRGCKQLHTVLANEFDGEEHTSVMPCSTNRSLTMFFEDWPLNQP